MPLQEGLDVVANLLAITVFMVSVYPKIHPWVRLWAQSLWRSTLHVTARAVPHWRKPLIALTAAWGFGGLLSYGLTSDMEGTAPVWAECLVGSAALFVWGYAGWQAVRWAVRQTRHIMA